MPDCDLVVMGWVRVGGLEDEGILVWVGGTSSVVGVGEKGLELVDWFVGLQVVGLVGENWSVEVSKLSDGGGEIIPLLKLPDDVEAVERMLGHVAA